MECRVVGIDQTVGWGIQRGMNMAVFPSISDKLTDLGLRLFDVELAEWQAQRRVLSIIPASFRAILPLKRSAVKAAADLGFTRIRIDYRHGGRAEPEALLELQQMLAEAQARKVAVCLLLCNASTLDEDHESNFFNSISGKGIMAVGYGDADGSLDPFSTYEAIYKWKSLLACEIEFYANNRHGLATANALAALRAGVKHIATSIAGVGNQPAWEEILAGQRVLSQCTLVDLTQLASRCGDILDAVGESTATTKAVIGADIFAHESGIHVDGIMKDPYLYELFSPESVGLKRKIVIGKHSGKAALMAKFYTWKIELTEGQAENLLEKVRALAVLQKQALSDEQLLQLYQ